MERLRKVKVLLVSKALVVGAYQRKLEELAAPARAGADRRRSRWLARRAVRAGDARSNAAHTAGYRADHRAAALQRPVPPPLLPDAAPAARPACAPTCCTWTRSRTTWRPGWRCAAASRRGHPQPLLHLAEPHSAPIPGRSGISSRPTTAAPAMRIAGNPTAATVLREKGYRGPSRGDRRSSASIRSSSRAERTRPQLINASDIVIGYAGRLVPEKGVHVLLAACARLRPGAWSLRNPGRRARASCARGTRRASWALPSRCGSWAASPPPRRPAITGRLDILVLPSLSRPNWVEQFGRVLIEAMACGVAVVGSASGEIPWVIGDAGVLFPEGDVRPPWPGLCRA